MTAGEYNFTIEQGTYFERIFTWKNLDGTAINITGCVPHLQVRDRRDNLIIDLSSRLTTVPVQGQVTLAIPDSVTSDLKFDTAKYDLELVGDKPRRLIKGIITVDPAETR